MSTVFLAVDQALKNNGITLWRTDGRTVELLFQTCITNPAARAADLSVKPYDHIRRSLVGLIRLYEVDVVFLEANFKSPSTNVWRSLLWAQFAVLDAAFQEDVRAEVVGAAAWQKYILGDQWANHRGAAKVNCKRVLQRALGVEFRNEHIGDSAGIGMFGAAQLGLIDVVQAYGIKQAECPDLVADPEKPAKPKRSRKPKVRVVKAQTDPRPQPKPAKVKPVREPKPAAKKRKTASNSKHCLQPKLHGGKLHRGSGINRRHRYHC